MLGEKTQPTNQKNGGQGELNELSYHQRSEGNFRNKAGYDSVEGQNNN